VERRYFKGSGLRGVLVGWGRMSSNRGDGFVWRGRGCRKPAVVGGRGGLKTDWVGKEERGKIPKKEMRLKGKRFRTFSRGLGGRENLQRSGMKRVGSG